MGMDDVISMRPYQGGQSQKSHDVERVERKSPKRDVEESVAMASDLVSKLRDSARDVHPATGGAARIDVRIKVPERTVESRYHQYPRCAKRV
jgi:hypothetical protein